MDFKEYTENALRTESPLPQDTAIDVKAISDLFSQTALNGNTLDALKKRIYYGRETSEVQYHPSEATKIDLRLVHGALGLATEIAELLQTLANALHSGDLTDKQNLNLQEELSDIEWYRALVYDALGLDESEIRVKNIAKLKARYGDKFSTERAYNRDTEAEMAAFENA